MSKKIVIKVVGSVIVVGIVASAIVFIIKRTPALIDNTEETPTSVSDNTLEKPEQEETITLPTPEEVKETTEKKDGYVEFVYDADESSSDYLKSKVKIEGSGTVIYNESGNSSDSSTGSSTKSNVDTTQEFWYKASEDKGNYINAITGYSFSKGFGAVMSQKYDINVMGVYPEVALFNAPNKTTLYVEERNYQDGDATYWRTKILNEVNLGYWASIMDTPILDYGTPYILGTGLTNWEALGYGIDDISVNEAGEQIICDTSIQCMFGEGYYFEFFEPADGLYHGHMILQHGNRVYHVYGKSEYHESLKDIITACADRCITVY